MQSRNLIFPEQDIQSIDYAVNHFRNACKLIIGATVKYPEFTIVLNALDEVQKAYDCVYSAMNLHKTEANRQQQAKANYIKLLDQYNKPRFGLFKRPVTKDATDTADKIFAADRAIDNEENMMKLLNEEFQKRLDQDTELQELNAKLPFKINFCEVDCIWNTKLMNIITFHDGHTIEFDRLVESDVGRAEQDYLEKAIALTVSNPMSARR